MMKKVQVLCYTLMSVLLIITVSACRPQGRTYYKNLLWNYAEAHETLVFSEIFEFDWDIASLNNLKISHEYSRIHRVSNLTKEPNRGKALSVVANA